VKGGYFGVLHRYPSELAQTFWTAIVAWTTCFLVTIIVSLVTRPRPESELEGLVYSLTPKPKDRDLPWIKRPASLALIVIVLIVGLNLLFL
jgi:SSS family solute:Na+ symporter